MCQLWDDTKMYAETERVLGKIWRRFRSVEPEA